ncbi:hypothetical protein ACFV3E_05925 [Streptomyces sp. NPDC059718]
MTDGATDYAQTIVVSAMSAAQTGAMSPEGLHTFVEEVKANPPE